jgi:hypothetical protein
MATGYTSWRMSQLRGYGDGEVVAGRQQARAPLELRDLSGTGTVTAEGQFELFGPGDVTRLAPGVISRRYPAPGATDAEETKHALVEFAGEALLDLPWRYTPERPDGNKLRPWMVLVVGRAGEVALTRDGKVTLSYALQRRYDLAKSYLWAHIHTTEEGEWARLLCPDDMLKDSSYTACLVPAFVLEPDGNLRDAWPLPSRGAVQLPCYDTWSFHTGPDGDFYELAKRLRARKPAELGETFGRAQVRYDRRSPGEPSNASLPTSGVLQRPADAIGTPAPVVPWIADEVAALATDVPTPDGRWVLSSPRYHLPFTEPGAAPAAGWSHALATDPRDRGAAGLGAWNAIAWQDRIAAAAATKAGDLGIARDRVGHLALGVEASRSLWRRHVPADPVGRLAVLGPMLGRLPAKGGGTVLDGIAGRAPRFDRALWSSAARRALRSGPARSALAAPGASRFEAVLAVASRCPKPSPDPYQVPVKSSENIEGKLKEAGYAIPFDAEDVFETLRALRRLAGEPMPCADFPIDKLGAAVAAAVDPTIERPVAVERVLSTLPGIVDIGPIEIEPELDLPLWSFVASAAPDWMLPGVGDLPMDRVVGLSTNPAFVEALLLGANHQAIAELRWRNMPIGARWSPLRKFWQRASGSMDIEPIRQWPAGSGFGAAGLAPAGLGEEAVVVFRTTLFRRYPATVVYLCPDVDWDPPTDAVLSARVFPSFVGSIGPDVTFFGFPVPPEALKTHWVVLEEPPDGRRFYAERDTDSQDGAGYARDTFAVPVRVMIGRLFGDT